MKLLYSPTNCSEEPHNEDQVLFINLGPSDGRGDRVIEALGQAYSPIDAPCLVV